MSKINKSRVGLVAIALAFVLALAAFGFISTGKGKDTELGQPVSVMRGDIQIATSADGRAVVDLTTELNFVSGGSIAAIYVKEGQLVKKWQRLARLDSRKLSYQETQAKAGYAAAVAKVNSLKDGPSDVEVESKRVAVENAETAVADAQTAYDYASGENAAGRVPQDQLIAKEAQLNNAKAQLKAAEAQLNIALQPANKNEIASARASANQASAAVKVASAAIDEAILKAPVDGTVLTINKSVGESVGAQSAPAEPFIVIGNISRMTIETQVEEIDIAKVSIGQKVKATFDALEGKEFYGEVDSISPRAKVDQNGVVTYLVRAIVENDSGAIKDGMTAHVDFILKQAKNVLLVPVKSVTRANGKPIVILQGADGSLKTKIVELGLTDGTSVEVKRGLSETDKIAVRKDEKKE